MSVSFVVPARNEAEYVGETLDAIRATGDHELVVVDGNSDDATPDIAREHGARVVTDRGTGQGRARHVLPRLSPPPLPGFNVFVNRNAYFDVGGFRTGPNEDMTFSRRLGRQYPTGVCPDVLVETSGRRIDAGVCRTLGHYTAMEFRRQLETRRYK